MRALVAGVVAFLLSCVVLGTILAVLLALITGTGAVPQPYHAFIGLFVGAIVAIFPALFAAWYASRR